MEMESKDNTPSVIAKLMGFDKLQPQHLPHRPIKALSEDYLRKTASLGLLETKSVRVKSKHEFGSEIPKADKRNAQSVSDVNPKSVPSTVRAQFTFAGQKNACARNLHSIDKKIDHPVELNHVLNRKHVSLRKSCKSLPERNVMRSIQKLENDSGDCNVDYMNTSIETQSKLKDETNVVLKTTSGKAQNCASGLLLLGHDNTRQGGDDVEDMEDRTCLKSESKTAENDNIIRGMEHRRNTSLGNIKAAARKWRNMGIVFSNASRHIVTDKVVDPSLCLPEALITSCQGSIFLRKRERISLPFPIESSFASEAKKRIFERWKTPKKFEEAAVSGRRHTHGKMFAMSDVKLSPKSQYSGLEKNCSSGSICHLSETCTSLPRSRKNSSTTEYIRNLPSLTLSKDSSIAAETANPKTRTGASKSCCPRQEGTVSQYELSSSITACLGSHDVLPLQLNEGVWDELDEAGYGSESSDAWDNLTQQVSCYDSPKGELIFRCTANDLNSVKNLREVNQPSPDSVLEPPFKEENVPISELFDRPVSDLSGLAMKLHLLDTKSERLSSVGSVMAVSGDEDTEKGSVDLSQDFEKLWGLSRPEESRDFYYLVDVLDEAASYGLDLDTWCKTWHEMEEYPLSHAVFEALEKKFGKQTMSWLKSERRLLFDRMNSVLRDILDSYRGFRPSAKPLRRRFNASPRKNDIEEELWMLLTQGKGAGNGSPEEALGSELKWLDLEDDIGNICKEIVEFLLDELAMEIL